MLVRRLTVGVGCWEVGVVERVAKSRVLRLEALLRRLPLAVSRASFASAALTVIVILLIGLCGLPGLIRGLPHAAPTWLPSGTMRSGRNQWPYVTSVRMAS